MQAVCEDLALSQEDDPPAPADQVGNLSDGYNLTITREIPMRFKSAVGHKAKIRIWIVFRPDLDRLPNCWPW